MSALPIDPLLPQVCDLLQRHAVLVLEAAPGVGKTTRVPRALLEVFPGTILTLEPRRLATRLAARRVAWELGEAVGGLVGYQVRMERVAGPRTRLLYMTEGVLTRRLLSDPLLQGVSCVVLDEFHERHLEGDLALALLRNLQRTARPDLKLLIMSATLDSRVLADRLGAPAVRADAPVHPLSVRFTPHSAATLEQRIAEAVEVVLREQDEGDVLVFLPGAAEIRAAARAMEELARRKELLTLPLHGDLPPEEQERALAPASRRKIILSTNVAESSVTIEGVRAVVDSGLARVSQDSPWTGLPELRLLRISQASAIQRAGRAARTAPGLAVRLYTQEEYLRSPERDTPELLRRELSGVCLQARAMGIGDIRTLEWLDPPPDQAVEAAEALLRRLGAIASDGTLTPLGREMAQLPLAPRLSRVALWCRDRGKERLGAALAAVLSAGERLTQEAGHAGSSDVLALVDAPRSRYASRLQQTILESLPAVRRRPTTPAQESDETTAGQALFLAFADRLAKRRRGREFQLCAQAGGGAALLARNSVVIHAPLLVAVEIEERREQGAPVIRLASAVEPEWLLDLMPERLQFEEKLEWDRKAERVTAVSRLMFDGLEIEASRSAPHDAEQAARLLAEHAWEAGWEKFFDREEAEEFAARLEFAGSVSGPAAQQWLRAPSEEDLRAALAALAHGCTGFVDLRPRCKEGALVDFILARIPAEVRRLLDEVAPLRLRLPGGRWARVRYRRNQAPWLAARLQDFFGWKDTPRIGGGTTPLVLHLLAPNQRPVQMTTDLAGFWERLYPAVRRELARRYPKHRWPENPYTAVKNADEMAI